MANFVSYIARHPVCIRTRRSGSRTDDGKIKEGNMTKEASTRASLLQRQVNFFRFLSFSSNTNVSPQLLLVSTLDGLNRLSNPGLPLSSVTLFPFPRLVPPRSSSAHRFIHFPFISHFCCSLCSFL